MKKIGVWIATGLGAILLWGGVQRVVGETFEWTNLFSTGLFTFAVLFFAPRVFSENRLSTIGWAVFGLLHFSSLMYALIRNTFAAWGATGCVFVFLLVVNIEVCKRKTVFFRWIFWGVTAAMAVGLPISISLYETHFAEEEFFVALQGVLLLGYWGYST